MALRHPFPETVLPDLRKYESEIEVLQVSRKPKTVSFRKGKDIADVVQEMVGYNRVLLNAAVGSGKSTLVPNALAKAAAKPVIHVVPSDKLAWSLFYYTNQKFDDVSFSMSPSDPISKTGVTITNSANIIALVLAKGVKSVFSDFPDGVILYLDESHESDCYTHAVRKAGHKFAGVSCVVEASATHEADRMSMAELDGEMTAEYFPTNDPPAKWDPADTGLPWSISTMEDNALIFIDDEAVAQRLIEKYNIGGLSAYRLTARMSVEQFAHIYKLLTNPTSGIIIMVADYSFRSGFTFPVFKIIDSCLVRYYTIEADQQVCMYRKTYKLEQYQAQHRGGRIAGSKCTYYCPKIKLESALCDLEGIEAEMAVTLFRLMGYSPPTYLDGMFAARGPVPKDIVAAANSSVAVPLLSLDVKHELIKEAAQEPVDDVVEELLRDYDSQPAEAVTDYFAGLTFNEAEFIDRHENGMEFLTQLKQLSGSQATLIPGRHYSMPGLPMDELYSELYGQDWIKALSELQDKPYLSKGFTRAQSLELIAMFLVQYNKAVATGAAIDNLLSARESLTRICTRYPDHVREWSDLVGAKYREAKSNQNSLIDAIELLRAPGMSFNHIDPDVGMETRIAEKYASRLTKAIESAGKVVDGADYLKYIESGLDDIGALPPKEYDKLTMHTSYNDGQVYVKSKAVKIGDKVMYELLFDMPNGLMYDRSECVDAVSYYLATIGLSPRLISKLSIVGSQVDPKWVLRQVASVKPHKDRRKSLTMKFSLKEVNKKRLTVN